MKEEDIITYENTINHKMIEEVLEFKKAMESRAKEPKSFTLESLSAFFVKRPDIENSKEIINSVLELKEYEGNSIFSEENSSIKGESLGEGYLQICKQIFDEEYQEEQLKNRQEFNELLSHYSEDDLKKIYILSIYERQRLQPYESFFDLFHDEHGQYYPRDKYCHPADERSLRERVFDRLYKEPYSYLAKCWQRGKEIFDKHEANVAEEKVILERRLASYNKKPPHTYFNREISRVDNIPEIIDELSGLYLENGVTEDISVAAQFLNELIDRANGWLLVDILNNGWFDHLDYVEFDNGILKLYLDYSRCSEGGQAAEISHNTRIDIAFDRLEIFKVKSHSSIALRGFFRDKKEVRQYYCNHEKVKKMISFYDCSMRFDKDQRGSVECFDVKFLPWRYFNIMIHPKSRPIEENLSAQPNIRDALPTDAVRKLLLLKNIMDIEERCDMTWKEYKAFQKPENYNYIHQEDSISMYGNRFRKMLESYIKLIFFAKQIAFKKSYEQDMLGDLLTGLKEYSKLDSTDGKEVNLFSKLIELVEDKLLKKLNSCSHDNVRRKIDESLIGDIYSDIKKIPHLLNELLIKI